MTLLLTLTAAVVLLFIIVLLAWRELANSALLTFLAVLTPLGGFLYTQSLVRPTRAALSFSVLGQYHRLTDTIDISSDSAADLVIDRAGAPTDSRVRLAYLPGSGLLSVEVLSSHEPVLLGARPVNAIRLGRRAVVQSGAGDSTLITRPWWCWYRCPTRRVGQDEASLRSALTVPMGADTFVLFRAARDVYVAADPGSALRVSGQAIPRRLEGRPDTLEVGGVDIAAAPNLAQHRLELRFADAAAVRRWDLAHGGEPIRRFLVSAARGSELPGIMPVINPATAAPGAARPPYGGVLAYGAQGWSWHTAGSQRALREGGAELLPGGTAATGHIVRIGRSDEDPGSTRNAAIVAWVLGGLLLAWSWRHVSGAGLALRLAIGGMIFTLAGVRGMLAFRAWLARPFDAQPTITFLALLIALPATIALYHAWEDISEAASESAVHRRTLLIMLLPVSAFIVIGLGAVLLQTGQDWRIGILRVALTPILLGVLGMTMLQQLLAPKAPGSRGLPGPLAALHPAGAQSSLRQFLTAVAVLAALGLLLFAVASLVTVGKALALIGLALVAVTMLLGVAGRPAMIQPQRGKWRFLLVAGIAITGAIAGNVIQSGIILPILSGAIAGVLGWRVAQRSYPRVRPLHLRDLMPAWFLLSCFLVAALIIVFGLTNRLRVTMEYALSLAGLVVISRIFAVLWFRQAERRALASRRVSTGTRPLPGIAALVLVLGLSAAIYLPLGLTDPGLILLFFSATTIAACVALGSFGLRGTLAGGAVLAGLVLTFFSGMMVRPSTLRRGSDPLSTAEIRYAAAYHPDALQRHMLRVQDGSPLTTVRTLQQYWGMAHYAAVGGLNGRGYFQTEFTSQGITRPVALTENAFSVFVLSEHGWLGGSMLLFCYLLLGLALLGAALYCCRANEHVPRALFLTGIAAFWLVPALYMAAANGSIVPLTGQNMPMLGLLSAADVALVTWLSAAALVAVPGIRAAGAEYVTGERVRRVRSGILVTAGSFGALTLLVIALLWAPAHAAPHDFRLDAVVQEAEALVENRMITRVPGANGQDTLAINRAAVGYPTLNEHRFLANAVRNSNHSARGGTGGPRCYEADPIFRLGSADEISVNPGICSQRATTERAYAWRGSLRAATGRPEYVLTDGRAAVIIAADAELESAAIGKDCAPPGIVRARSARLGCTAEAPLSRPGRSALTLESGGGSAVVVNGLAPGPITLLNNGDHISIPGQADVLASEVPRGALAYPRWENGQWRRLAAAAGPTWLVQLDTQLTRALSTRARETNDAVVTIDAALQLALRSAVNDACALIPGARSCTVLLADPGTGAIRALADAPAGRVPQRHRPGDGNLRSHPGASAVKPLIAAAALNAYPRLQQLEVEHSAAIYTSIANTPIAPFRAARLYPGARVPWAGFLPASDNVYAATLGFLAAAPRQSDGLPARRGSENSARLTVGGVLLAGRPAWKVGGKGRLDLTDSPLATELNTIFDVVAAGASETPHDRRFFADAIELGVLRDVPDLQRVTPEAIALRLDSIDSARDLASFMIGGGTNRWSNLAMVQALAELYTGRDVRLHLLSAVGADTLKRAFEPSQLQQPAREAVLSGMRAVVREPWATGGALRNAFTPNVQWLGKTGTLQEEWIGSVFLFAGSGRQARGTSCAVAGIVTIELGRGGNPDGRATALFQSAVAPLLKRYLGWGDRVC